jgi:hypothetical protein
VHQNHLVANVTAGSAQTARLLHGMRTNFLLHGADGVTASRKALGAIYGLVQQHAAMLAFVEAFWLMGLVFLLMLPFLPLLQYSRPVRSAKAVPTTEEAGSPSNLSEVWPDSLEQDAHNAEEHNLVLH